MGFGLRLVWIKMLLLLLLVLQFWAKCYLSFRTLEYSNNPIVWRGGRPAKGCSSQRGRFCQENRDHFGYYEHKGLMQETGYLWQLKRPEKQSLLFETFFADIGDITLPYLGWILLLLLLFSLLLY